MSDDKLPSWIVDNIPEDLARSELFVFNVNFANGNKVEVNLLHDLDIDYEELEQHLERIPAQYMYWAAMYSELRGSVAILEKKAAMRRSAVISELLSRFKQEGIKLTDKQVLGIVDSDERLAKCELEVALAQKKTGKLYHMVEAIKIRSEHCRSLAGFKRQDKEQSSHQT